MVRLTGRPDMTLDVYRGRKTIQQQQHSLKVPSLIAQVLYEFKVSGFNQYGFLPFSLRKFVFASNDKETLPKRGLLLKNFL